MTHDVADFDTVGAWKAELECSKRLAEPYWVTWQENVDSYVGSSKDAKAANQYNAPYINTNSDFTNCEVKLSQLFFEQPELQLSAKGEFRAQPPAAQIPGAPPQPAPDKSPIVAAHRELLNELLGPDHADVLTTVHKAIKDCLVTAGVGATKICYEAAMESIAAPPQLGAVLGLKGNIDRPVDEQWQWSRIASKKFRIPSDFTDTDFDRAPWLAMEFRMPLAQAKRLFEIPADFDGTKSQDEHVFEMMQQRTKGEASNIPYIDGHEIWYLAYIFDKDVVNPRLYRRHVVVEGLDTFVEKTRDNPYQTLLPNGRLSADSMVGSPLHPLVIRTVPDSAFIPSDATMTRPLVRELCKFRTQQVQEREANLPRIGYDTSKVPPDTIQRIEEGTIGMMIPFPPDSLAQGMEHIMAQIAQGNQTRGSYTANDYIQRDLDKTLGIDALGSGVKSGESATATEIKVVDRQRNVRLDSERAQVLRWYLKGVRKFSALVCRFMTPQLAVPYIGQAAAQAWAQWDKKTWDGRFVFVAKPDSQLKLDGAAERKFYLDLYQFIAKDPMVKREAVLKPLLEKANINPAEAMNTAPPPKKPDVPTIGFTFKGEDLLGPQAQQVREILAQGGVQISQQAIDASATQLFQQMQMGIRDASGQMVKATAHPPAEHGGAAEQVRPLSQASADTSAQREGMGQGAVHTM